MLFYVANSRPSLCFKNTKDQNVCGSVHILMVSGLRMTKKNSGLRMTKKKSFDLWVER